MFEHFRNIDTAFRYVRIFTAVVVAAFALTTTYTIFSAFAYAKQKDQRVYVVLNGKLLEATASNKKDNITVEARDHVKVFHQLFFNLVPDEKAIEQNIKQALYLADRSAKEAYDNLKENGFYTQVVSANISQGITTDSIIVDLNKDPIYFRYYGKQQISRPTAITTRSLITEGYLRDLGQRTDNNPHGFLIQKWTILQNTDLETLKR